MMKITIITDAGSGYSTPHTSGVSISAVIARSIGLCAIYSANGGEQ